MTKLHAHTLEARIDKALEYLTAVQGIHLKDYEIIAETKRILGDK